MANRYFPSQFMYGFEVMPVTLQASAVIDSAVTGKTKSLKGGGIKAITWVATGTYKVQLDDTYNRLLTGAMNMVEGITGTTIVTAITPGVVYVIRALGTTTQAQWETAGVPVGVTAAVGVAFLCAATSAGTGTCATPLPSGISEIEIIGDAQTTVTQLADPYLMIQTLGATDASTTTLIPKDPANTSVLKLQLNLRNSGNKSKGE